MRGQNDAGREGGNKPPSKEEDCTSGSWSQLEERVRESYGKTSLAQNPATRGFRRKGIQEIALD